MRPWQRIAIFTAGLVALVGGGIGVVAGTGTSSGIGTTTTTTLPVTTTRIGGGGGTPCQYCAYYAGFTNGFPSVNTWFPIGVFDAGGNPGTGGNVPMGCSNQGCQMQKEGLNFLVQADNGPPSQALVTSTINNFCTYGIYGILWHNVTTSGSEPVSLMQNGANAANAGCAKYLAGYQIGDEDCSASEVTTINAVLAADRTRMANLGESSGNTTDSTCYTTQNASSLISGDTYPVLNPYEGSVCLIPNAQSDCLWLYGVQTARYVFHDTSNHPVFVDIDPGTTAKQFSGSGCNTTTNQCPPGNEAYMTPEQVNSSVWETLINRANGVLYFCPDNYNSGSDACLGGGASGNPANCNLISSGFANNCIIPGNLTWIDAQVASYAVALNAPNDGYCRMISAAIGGTANFSPPYTTCSGGDLTVSTSNTNEPVVAMTRKVGSSIYLFTMADKANGTTTVTYTISDAHNQTATLIYDSAQHYNPGSYNDRGNTFPLNGSGVFTDTLTGDTGNAANAISYQVKIYAIS